MSEVETRASIPKWITEAYLQSILIKKYPNLKVESFIATPPVAAGNNYASLILRVQAQCKLNEVKKNISVIIKTTHFNAESAEIISEYGAHENEMIMYSQHLPKFQKLLESIGDDDKLAPQAIFVDNDHKALIFEDLKESNYKMASRKFGLDVEHMQIITRKLAKFHACSIILQEQGEKFSSFRKSIINEETHGFDPFFLNMCHELGEEIKNWKGYEKYGDKIFKLADRIIEQGVEAYKKNPKQTLVLNHGDSWTANMMFTYDKNCQVYDAALIDFQICCVASPVLDLSYFFNTSACDGIKFKQDNFYKMIKLYHEHLTDTLIKLKSTMKLPTLFELIQEYHQQNFLDVINILIFPVMINENEQDADMMNLMTDTEKAKAFRRQLFQNPRAVGTMKHFLPLWDAKGLLDQLK